MNRRSFVIVGGSAAGMTAATRLRRNCPEASITVVERGPHISYAACGLPYYVSGDVRDIASLILYTPEEIYERYRIDVRTGHEAVRIHPRKRLLEVRDLKTGYISDLSYDKLILGTGARAVLPDIPGRNLENVFCLRRIDDAVRLRELLDSGLVQRAVIAGSGYLGLELVEAVRKHSVDALLIEMKPHIFDPIELDIASLVKDELLKNGCQILKSVTIDRLTGSQDRVHSALLSNGSEVKADLVLFAAGVKPEVGLAVQAGAGTGPSGALRVSPKMETSMQNIYAIGDCVEVKDRASGKYVYAPLATAALKQARIAADNACGSFTKYEGITGTAIVKVFGLEVARTGIDKSQIAFLGLPAETVAVKTSSRAAYYPGAEDITTVILFDKTDGRLLGAQMAGREGVSKRIDVFATAIYNRMTVMDLLNLDLSYTPPFSPSWDPVLIAAMQAVKKVGKR